MATVNAQNSRVQRENPPFSGNIQPKSTQKEDKKILTHLENNLQKGSFIALHDLFSLLDRPNFLADSARILLENYTFFQPNEINLRTCTRQQAMQFWNENENLIGYSDLMKAFYITPIEFQSPPPSTQFRFHKSGDSIRIEKSRILRNYVQDWANQLKSGDSSRLNLLVQRIADLNTREAYGWLISVIENRTLGNNRHPVYNQIANKLRDFPQLRTIEALLAAHSDSIFLENDILPTLILAANQPIPAPETMRNLLDSLENNLELIRYNGYLQSVPFSENSFYERVHFFGKIMSDYNNLAYIRRNANLDLIATEDPRALFYTAVQARLSPKNQQLFFQRLEKMTHLELHLVEPSGNTVNVSTRLHDIVTLKKIIHFWATHYDDFEWDKTQQHFVNKAEIATRKERYENAFRRLNSTNDSAARAAFLLLTEGEPKEVENLATRYRSLFNQNINSLLPNLRYNYIEQLANLTRYCRLHQINYEPTDSIQILLTKLQDDELTAKNRFEIENELLNILTIDQITAVEYNAFQYANQHFEQFMFSSGRIIDIFYSKNWKSIVENPVQLRLFLKKTTLFRKIGLIGGVCESYRRKLDAQTAPPSIVEKMRQMLEFLAQTEDDNDILEEIKAILNDMKMGENGDEDPDEPAYWVQQIINSPNFYDETMTIKRLKSADVQAIVNALQLERDREIVKIYFKILLQNADIDAVPHLFRILGDGRTIERSIDNQPITIGQKVVETLENIYKYNFPTEDIEEKINYWKKLRDTDGENFRQWENLFFEKRIAELQNQINREQPIEFANLYTMLSSRLYTESEHRNLVLSALPRLKPLSAVKLIGQKIKLNPKTELKIFEKIAIPIKDLDKVLSAFTPEKQADYAELMEFVNRKIEQYRQRLLEEDNNAEAEKRFHNELGNFTNDLFRNVRWFGEALRTEKIPPQYRQPLADNLSVYLNMSGDLLSENEYQTTQLHIVQIENVGQSVVTAIRKINQLDLSPNERQTLQTQYLARATYRELSEILAIANEIAPEALLFIQYDFGLPLFEFDSIACQDFIKNHQKMTVFELYRKYLNQFGVSFEQSTGELDYQKIYNILKFEVVSPFAAIGGKRRDYFAYGIIKLLEFEFQTTLNFHEKLGENQSTHTFNAAKRAAAWMQFLASKQLINPDQSEPPSFNRAFVSK